MTPVPKLLPSYPGRQLVDGNNFLLNRFREDAGGLVIRNIMADIRACLAPPVFVFDGANANARRRKLLPSYKMRSAKALVARENLWPMLELFRSLMPFLPAVAVSVPSWEADDVLATLALAHAGPSRIVTTDRDLSQLAVHPRIQVTADLPGVPPSLVRLYKTFVGDASDNILGVKGFGKKSWGLLNKPLASTLDFAAHSADALGLKPHAHEWCVANATLVASFWSVIGLLDVPMTDIVPHVKVGLPDPRAVDHILREFLL